MIVEVEEVQGRAVSFVDDRREDRERETREWCDELRRNERGRFVRDRERGI